MEVDRLQADRSGGDASAFRPAAGPLLYRFADAARIDRESRTRFPEAQLMGQAALSAFLAIQTQCFAARRLFVLCGPGNNGGDGYAFVFHLYSSLIARDPEGAGMRLREVAVIQSKPPSGEAARRYANECEAIAAARPGPLLRIRPAEEFLSDSVKYWPAGDDLILEALLGTGQDSAPRGSVAELLERIAEVRARPSLERPRLISLDLPTGCREGEAQEFAPPGQAASRRPPAPDEVLGLGSHKLALYLNAGLVARAKLRALPLGFAPESRPENRVRAVQLVRPRPGSDGQAEAERGAALRAWFRRSPAGHKYDQGHACLAGGAGGMEGALLMAARSFFAAGGGILHGITPDESSRQFLTQAMPGVMFQSCPGASDAAALRDLRPAAIGAGPGLGKDGLAQMQPALLAWLNQLAEAAAPWIILDARAAELVREADYPESLRERTILTPHGGEWRRLGGPALDCAEGFARAQSFNAGELRVWTLVKGATSALLPPRTDAEALLFAWPEPNLAVAGTGDCLVGALAATAARRRPQSEPVGAADLVAAAMQLLYFAAARNDETKGDAADGAVGAFHLEAGALPDRIRAALAGGAA